MEMKSLFKSAKSFKKFKNFYPFVPKTFLGFLTASLPATAASKHRQPAGLYENSN